MGCEGGVVDVDEGTNIRSAEQSSGADRVLATLAPGGSPLALGFQILVQFHEDDIVS